MVLMTFFVLEQFGLVYVLVCKFNRVYISLRMSTSVLVLPSIVYLVVEQQLLITSQVQVSSNLASYSI